MAYFLLDLFENYFVYIWIVDQPQRTYLYVHQMMKTAYVV